MIRASTTRIVAAASTACALAAAALPSHVHGAVIVTECDVVVDSGRVVLGNDLDCTGSTGIVVLDAAVVDLAGYTITGGATAISSQGRCKVFSDPPGGVITGQTTHAIDCGFAFSREGGATVSDITISSGGSGMNDHAISADGRIKLKRVTITNWTDGIVAHGPIKASVKMDAVVIDNIGGDCVHGSTLKVKNSSVTNCDGIGLRGGGDHTVAAISSTVSNNAGNGIQALRGRVKIKDSDVSGNGGIGTDGKPVKAKSSTITNNTERGISANSVRLKDTMVTGNGTSVDCGVTIACADVASLAPPSLSGTSVCDTSYDMNSGFPGTSWSVCSLD